VYFPAGTMRGSKQEVRIGSSARTVQMAFEIDTPAASSVAVVIRAVPGAEVWSAREVPVRLREGMRTAVIDLPASLLQNGSYEATVALAGEAGVEQLFPFLVRRD
jgi:hypothetical protein